MLFPSETPLTLAVQAERPREMILALVAGGAHLDYRAADGFTPLHRASARGNCEAIKVGFLHENMFISIYESYLASLRR
ncbi:unnamed protein product [Protopolystoma xenopodis]|uniref:Uncharacterized protein n=1 Tax=Protopolystoma xenopodis TaxID=117903 RepID=A0A3S5CRL1_9PLAT|nr:unnamed protein product [Protopolystoma xenopodis]